MIVRMSKVEIVGPKRLLQDIISLLRDLGVLQIEPVPAGFIEKEYEGQVRSFLPDEETLSERLFLENLLVKINELFSYLPMTPVRKSYIAPELIIETITRTIERHGASCRELYEKKESLSKERSELEGYTLFLTTLASFLEQMPETPDLDFIGLTIREPEMVGRVREMLSRVTNKEFELVTEKAENGTLVGLITIEKGLSEKVKDTLSDERIPELSFPPSFKGRTFREKIAFIRKRGSELSEEIERIEAELDRFSQRWAPIYERAREWAEERLSLLRTTASVFETRMCFCINGWMPSEDVGRLRERLRDVFKGEAVVLEKELLEEDLERVPIALKNPSYFKPFELFVRLLPLPKYTSLDPTPFIGIFFPVFFGMILGDAGYGILLVIFSAVTAKRFAKRAILRDGAKILFVSSLYAVLFGVLYGEFFGELGHAFLGLRPLAIDRVSAAIPMLVFALSVGIVHLTLGLFLGFLTALKKKTKKEALSKLLTILIIACVAAAVASLFGLAPALLARPLVIALLVLTPLLFFTGGLLAPLELFKSIGNIISYARIMAIGLSSALLAHVANSLAGMAGNIFIGAIVGGLLHLINLVLGVFAPAIQSLRLHYVEFFSKFLEHGGRRFEPLRRG